MRVTTRLAYASGGAPSALVVSLTTGFILLYYSNALGASAAMVGAAMALALLFDALWDPLVGYLSDNTRSRLGRRHPFLYLAVIPVSVLCWAVWNPPRTLSPAELVLYLLATIIPLRLTLALFDVPSNALTAELTSDYDERTRLATYRTCTSWLFITGFTATLYAYWLSPSPEFPDGLLNPDGYRNMGDWASLTLFATMLFCAIGLHSQIHILPQQADKIRLSFSDLASSVLSTFREPSTTPLLITSAAISTGFAIYAALFPFQYAYFWRLDSTELSLTTLPWFIGLLMTIAITPFLGKIGEKRRVASFGIVGLACSIATPVLLEKCGLVPQASETKRFIFLCLFLLIDMMTYLIVTSALASMLADAVEHRALHRGRREEGTIFAAQTLVLKLSSALGVLIAGILIQAIGFKDGNESTADAGVIDRLGSIWIFGNVIFYVLSLIALSFYRLTRQQHLENIIRLNSEY